MGEYGAAHQLGAHAKINLFLEVMGCRADGFHALVSVFQEVDLADTLTARATNAGTLTLSSDTPNIPTCEENLVIRAVRLLQTEMDVREGIHFHLEKRIPVGGGLGGGSSDAAAALRLANLVWNLGLDRDQLAGFAARIGSDVPFFLWGGTCLCEGRGERVTPLERIDNLAFTLVMPTWGIATAEAYRRLPQSEFASVSVEPFLAALARNDLQGIAEYSFNRFTETVFALEPRQRKLHETLVDLGMSQVCLSGSGSTVWGLEQKAPPASILRSALPRKDIGAVITTLSHSAQT